MTLDWITSPCKAVDLTAQAAAHAHQNNLTKPPGSLGELETLALRFAAWQGTDRPTCEAVLTRVFAGDHGVCRHGVSAFPQAVTEQMILNFVNGGAAISVLARTLGADFAVVNMGTIKPTEPAAGLVNVQLAAGTRDFSERPAMTGMILEDALLAGREQILGKTTDLFIGGDMGIGNTTSASAIYSALLGLSADETVGPGTGVDSEGLAIKRQVVDQSLQRHHEHLESPIAVLRCLGGLEIAALVGAYISAAQQGIPVLVDGFISTAAALVAVELNPSTRQWMLFAHQSAEPAHVKALAYLQASPLLSLNMRLGEGSGAAVAVSLIQSALRLHNEMATFADAHVSGKKASGTGANNVA